MADALPIPILAPLEAIAYFRRKGFLFGFSWQDVWQEEHARAFTVAKAMTRDLLETIRAAVDAAIADGQTLDQFRDDLRPKLETAGWWGKKRMIDPLTAQAKTVQLGSPRRLKTIFTTNMTTSYQAGKWERFDRQKAAMPFLEYTSAEDSKVRPQHAAWDGTILPIDHPWWNTHYGPCDWGCRCSARAYSRRMMERRGKSITATPAAFPTREWRNKRTGEIHVIEEGIGAGWSYNVGKAALAAQAPTPMPGSFDGADIADARAAAAPIAAFFAAFGIEAADAQRGQVFMDRGGWPLAISLAWFQQDGRLALPAPARRSGIGDVGRAIAEPDAIRWVWVRALDGPAMLMRRYVTARWIVDVGKQGWRFLSTGEAALEKLGRAGVAAWIKGDAIAAFNPHQPRFGKGGPKGGQFRTTHGAGLRASLVAGGAPTRAAIIGQVSDSTARLTARLNIETAGKRISLNHSYATKILNRHSRDNERDPRQDGVSVGDLFRAAKHLNASNDISRDERGRAGRDGQPRFEARTKVGNLTVNMVFEVNVRDVTLVTMFKRR